MPIKRRVDDLIAAGRHALGPHSGPMALSTLEPRGLRLHDSDAWSAHVYTTDFENCVRQGEKKEKEK